MSTPTASPRGPTRGTVSYIASPPPNNVSSCTAVAHLAGALGVPVWLALSKVSDWRWMLDRDDSPWYPTMRLFRQTALGQWPDVFDRMAEALREQL